MNFLNFDTVLNIVTLLAVIFAVYKYFRDPDESAKLEIELMKQKCNLLHGNIDNDIYEIKHNHLNHIEKDMKEIQQAQIKIFTILEERLPQKNV